MPLPVRLSRALAAFMNLFEKLEMLEMLGVRQEIQRDVCLFRFFGNFAAAVISDR
jgi:hypothetical protein